MKKLKNKLALVLGGTGGIGSAIADLLEKEGATVIRHGRGGKYGADVTKDGALKKLIDKVLAEYKRIDVVINSLSAPIVLTLIENKKWPDFLAHLNIQLKAAIDSVVQLVPKMKSQGGGKFINIVSVVVQNDPPKKYADYVTAKYALLGFSKTLAEELRGENIFVNCVSPDFVKTELTKVFPEKLAEIIAEQKPTGRLTTPRDVAQIVLDFTLDDSGRTGENIILSGGKIKK